MIRFDSGVFDLASAEFDEKNGWLDVSGTCAIAGVMDYHTGSELLPHETLAATVGQLVGMPVTIEHPPDLLTPDTASQYARGSVLSAKIEGDRLVARLRVLDSGAIAAIQAGKRELSPGYRVELDSSAGEWKGKKYDAVQRGRWYNHLAIVDRARAGREARLDSMDTITIEINGQQYELPAPVVAYIEALKNPPESAQQEVEVEDSKKMDAADIQRLITESVAQAIAKHRQDSEVQSRALRMLPLSYRADGKTATDILADAIVAAQPSLKAVVSDARGDSARLQGIFDAVVAVSAKPIENVDPTRADAGPVDEIEAARARYLARTKGAKK